MERQLPSTHWLLGHTRRAGHPGRLDDLPPLQPPGCGSPSLTATARRRGDGVLTKIMRRGVEDGQKEDDSAAFKYF